MLGNVLKISLSTVDEVDVTRADVSHVPEAAVLIAHVGTNIRYCLIPNDEKLKLTIDSIIEGRATPL